MDNYKSMAVILGRKGALIKKMKKLPDAGQEVSEAMSEELKKYDEDLTALKSMGEADWQEKKRISRRVLYARKRKEKEELLRMMSEGGEKEISDKDEQSGSDSDCLRSAEPRGRRFEPNWNMKPIGYKRSMLPDPAVTDTAISVFGLVVSIPSPNTDTVIPASDTVISASGLAAATNAFSASITPVPAAATTNTFSAPITPTSIPTVAPIPTATLTASTVSAIPTITAGHVRQKLDEGLIDDDAAALFKKYRGPTPSTDRHLSKAFYHIQMMILEDEAKALATE